MSGAEGERAYASLERSRALARLLDSAVRVPGTRFRIGIDPILGLVPGVGDAAATVLSLHLLATATQLRAPAPVIARMGLNVAVDALIGAIPFAGDAFDFVWKANRRNLRLLERWLERPERVQRGSSWLFAGIAAVLLLVAATLIALPVWGLVRLLG